MNWIDLVWPAMSGACLMLAGVHLLVWVRQREQLAQLYFSISAFSVAALCLLELWCMHAQSAQQYAVLLRWGHVALAVFFVSIVLFVRLHLDAGRRWLGNLAIGLRLASLIPNFLTGVNINFQAITSLKAATLWGGAEVVLPVGPNNPWMHLGQAAFVALTLFLADAIIFSRAGRSRAERQRVLLVCGALLFFVLVIASVSSLVVTGRLAAPLAFMPAFVGVVLVMSFDLGNNLLRAVRLAGRLESVQSNLRQSEQRMSHAIRAAGLGSWDWDIATGEVWFSEHGYRMVGLAPSGHSDSALFRSRVHADDHEVLDAALASAEKNGGEYSCEFRVPQNDGSPLWIEALGQMEFGADRRPSRLRGVLVDVTERKHAVERFRLLIEAAPTAKVVVAADGRIDFTNQQAERMFGYSPSELTGQSVDLLVPEMSRHRHAQHRDAFHHQPSARTMGVSRELFGQRKDGTAIPLEIVLSPITLGSSPMVLAVITDISERLRAERESQVQRDELAHLSRVALLAELSGSLAHELNQPLTAILSNAQAAMRFMAMSPPDLDEVRESLVNIVESDKRAGEVIRRLRAMLRKDPPEFQRLDLNDVVLDVLRIIRSDLLNRSVEVRLDLSQQLPPVQGDRVQLQQILLNLIMNGSDAMAELTSGRVLNLRTAVLADGKVEAAITDFGRGIPVADLERIFTPFVTSKTDGMGLGLAVCTTIANAHGGRLWASNNDGAGATLHLELPALQPSTEH